MAVSTITKDYVVKTYSVTTQNNAYVSPYGAYGDKAIDTMSGYTPVSTEAMLSTSTNLTATRLIDNRALLVYSKTATTVTVKVLYVKG